MLAGALQPPEPRDKWIAAAVASDQAGERSPTGKAVPIVPPLTRRNGVAFAPGLKRAGQHRRSRRDQDRHPPSHSAIALAPTDGVRILPP
jgi:hypothetical protein